MSKNKIYLLTYLLTTDNINECAKINKGYFITKRYFSVGPDGLAELEE